MNNKQKLAKAIKLVEEGNIPDYFEFMQSEVGENGTLEVDKKANLSLLQNTVIEGKESVAFANRLILLARTFFDEQATKDRKDLLEGLANRYEKRLNKKLEETLFQNIEVDLEYTTEGTSKKHVETYFIEKEAKPAGDFEKLFSRYLNELKSLLILGNAGSGKTVLLLKIGKELVKLAKKDALYPLPVLVNLASWRNDEKDFKTWLESVLVFSAGESGISKDYAKDLVKENNLLLLLDGLDEIPEEHRNSCLEAFKQYATEVNNNRKYYPEWVMCSRKNEYKQIEKDAFVQASVLFKPLTDEKIQATLHTLAKDKNMAAQALLTKIAANADITEHFRTAFEFHLALKMANEENFRADNLVEDFIDKELKEVTPDYSKAKHYLSFLAKKMMRTKKRITFELIDMQPSWLEKKWKFRVSIGFFLGFIGGLMSGLVWGLLWGAFSGLILGVFWGVIAGFSFGGISGLFDGLVDEYITVQEIRQFDWKPTPTNKLGESLKIYLIIDIIKRKVNYNLYQQLYIPFVLDFLQYVFIILVCVLAFYIVFFQGDFFMILWWCYRQVIGIALSLALLLSPLLQHFILRFLLWQEGKIPLRWVSLLNKLDEKTGILEKDGGQWRFRHQLLQDALASSS
jgi:hypothetical protein